MKMPTHCPFCKDVMLTDYEQMWEVLHKKCSRRLGHNIEFVAEVHDNDTVDVIAIKVNHKKIIMWSLFHRTLTIKSTDALEYQLPFFEPELFSYPKLMGKLKTYMVFS
jgi:hypothetical protein